MTIREFIDEHNATNRMTETLYICSEKDSDYNFVADNGLALEQNELGDYEVIGYEVEERDMWRTKKGRDIFIGKVIVYRIEFVK